MTAMDCWACRIEEAVYTDEVFGAADKGALLLDCSTIDVATARRVHEAAAARDFEMVDAPPRASWRLACGDDEVFDASDFQNRRELRLWSGSVDAHSRSHAIPYS